MAVENSSPPAASGTPQHGRRQGDKKNWFQQHKGLAIAGAAGAGFLVISHKGSQSSGSSSTDDSGAYSQAAQDAAAEQAAIDTAGSSGGDTGGGDSGGGDSSGGSDGTDTSDSPSSGSDGSSDGSDGGSAGDGSGGLTVNITNKIPKTAAAKKTHPAKKGTKEQKTKQGEHKQENKNDKGKHDSSPAHHPATKTPSTAGKKKPAPKKPAPKTSPRKKTRGSVLKYGRAFPGAIACHVTKSNVSSDGVLHEVVVVNFGGYSEAHMSHNHGQAWTDNVPGYTPPSRGVPLERLGTR